MTVRLQLSLCNRLPPTLPAHFARSGAGPRYGRRRRGSGWNRNAGADARLAHPVAAGDVEVLDEEAEARGDRLAAVLDVVDLGEPGAEAVRGQHIVEAVGGIFEQEILLVPLGRPAMRDQLQPPLAGEQRSRPAARR